MPELSVCQLLLAKRNFIWMADPRNPHLVRASRDEAVAQAFGYSARSIHHSVAEAQRWLDFDAVEDAAAWLGATALATLDRANSVTTADQLLSLVREAPEQVPWYTPTEGGDTRPHVQLLDDTLAWHGRISQTLQRLGERVVPPAFRLRELLRLCVEYLVWAERGDGELAAA